MNDVAVTVSLVLVGLVHLLPGMVALSPRRAVQAYGITLDDPAVTVVLRHRGVLLAVVGAGLLVGALWSQVRPLAVGSAAASMIGFIVLAAPTPGLGPALRRVLWIDIAALTLLIPAAVSL